MEIEIEWKSRRRGSPRERIISFVRKKPDLRARVVDVGRVKERRETRKRRKRSIGSDVLWTPDERGSNSAGYLLPLAVLSPHIVQIKLLYPPLRWLHYKVRVVHLKGGIWMRKVRKSQPAVAVGSIRTIKLVVRATWKRATNRFKSGKAIRLRRTKKKKRREKRETLYIDLQHLFRIFPRSCFNTQKSQWSILCCSLILMDPS